MADLEKLLSVAEVAEILGVQRSWVERAVRRNEIRHIRLGRYIRFRQSSINEWVAQQENKP